MIEDKDIGGTRVESASIIEEIDGQPKVETYAPQLEHISKWHFNIVMENGKQKFCIPHDSINYEYKVNI